MRGETTIQLFDAKTGEKVLEKKEKNLVTNAISKLLSPKNEWLYGNSQANILGLLLNATPFPTRALGGVLLFDQDIPEDANTILPPAGVNNVAYAGGEYAASNELRGTYNTNESGPITGGYRHVWDFGTDKANGTIKSVCLTSLLGGNAGWKQPPQGDASVGSIAGLQSFVNPVEPARLKNIYGRPIFIKSTPESGEIETITYHDGKLFKVKEANINSLKLTSKFNTLSNVTEKNYTYEEIGKLKVATHGYTYPEVRMYYMDGKIHHVYSSDGALASMGIIHDIYTLDGELELTKTVATATAFNGRTGAMFYFKGHYYMPTTSQGLELSVFSEDGTLTKTLAFGENPTSSSTSGFSALTASYVPQLDSIILSQGWAGNNVAYFYRLEEGDILTALHLPKTTLGAITLVATEDNILPYILFALVSDSPEGTNLGSYRIYYGFWTNYLGTINNLATSITKAKSQTMKLVYTIYDD